MYLAKLIARKLYNWNVTVVKRCSLIPIPTSTKSRRCVWVLCWIPRRPKTMGKKTWTPFNVSLLTNTRRASKPHQRKHTSKTEPCRLQRWWAKLAFMQIIITIITYGTCTVLFICSYWETLSVYSCVWLVTLYISSLLLPIQPLMVEALFMWNGCIAIIQLSLGSVYSSYFNVPFYTTLFATKTHKLQ